MSFIRGKDSLIHGWTFRRITSLSSFDHFLTLNHYISKYIVAFTRKKMLNIYLVKILRNNFINLKEKHRTKFQEQAACHYWHI